MSQLSNSDPSVNPPLAYVHKNVMKASSKLGGYGLFAIGTIRVGEIVSWESAQYYEGPNDLRPGKKIMTTAQMWERWPDPKEFDRYMAWFYQVGEDTYLGPLDENDIGITTYQNHSCDPNTWWYDDFTLIARREIVAGEEVTFDYGTCESIPNPEMPKCYCGSPLCRGEVRVDDYLNPVLQERYGNHFVSYLLERQRKAREAAHAAENNPAPPQPTNLKVEPEGKIPIKAYTIVEDPKAGFIEFFDN
jgi:hypothetical protein